jgi:hypothetical protein
VGTINAGTVRNSRSRRVGCCGEVVGSPPLWSLFWFGFGVVRSDRAEVTVARFFDTTPTKMRIAAIMDPRMRIPTARCGGRMLLRRTRDGGGRIVGARFLQRSRRNKTTRFLSKQKFKRLARFVESRSNTLSTDKVGPHAAASLVARLNEAPMPCDT